MSSFAAPALLVAAACAALAWGATAWRRRLRVLWVLPLAALLLALALVVTTHPR